MIIPLMDEGLAKKEVTVGTSSFKKRSLKVVHGGSRNQRTTTTTEVKNTSKRWVSFIRAKQKLEYSERQLFLVQGDLFGEKRISFT